jgi:hypothetical protein
MSKLLDWLDQKPNESEVKDAIDGMEIATDALDELERLGVEIPVALRRAMGALSLALTTGKDLGDAGKEAEKHLHAFTSRLASGCYGQDSDEMFICMAGYERKWQLHAVDYTLNINNKNSVIRLFMEKQLDKLVNRSFMQRIGRSLGLPIT